VGGLWVLWYGGGLSGGRRGRGAGRRVALSSERRDCLKIEIEMFRFRVSTAESKLESGEKRGVRRGSITFSIYTRDRTF
jgi:hypothetical protein